MSKCATIKVVGILLIITSDDIWRDSVARRGRREYDDRDYERSRSSRRSNRSNRRDNYQYSSGGGGRKSAAEARVERLTWFALVLVFGGIYFFQDANLLPNWFVPMTGAI